MCNFRANAKDAKDGISTAKLHENGQNMLKNARSGAILVVRIGWISEFWKDGWYRT